MDLSAFLPPHQPVELPSRGKLYTNPALKDGWINIREYAAPEESLLAQMNRENVQQVLNSVLDSCIKGDDIKAEELTSEDAFYLLVWLRANSYGPNYDIEVTCPHNTCGFGPDSHTINLSNLRIVYFEDDTVPEEPLIVELPKTKIKVQMMCLRRSTEIKAAKRVPVVQQWRNYKGDPTELLKRAYSISKVTLPDGEEVSSRLDIEQLCLQVLPSLDSLAIDKAVEKFNHGVDVRTEVTCRQCERTIYTIVPPGPEFFRPSEFDPQTQGASFDGNPSAEQVREDGLDVCEELHTDGENNSPEAVEGTV